MGLVMLQSAGRRGQEGVKDCQLGNRRSAGPGSWLGLVGSASDGLGSPGLTRRNGTLMAQSPEWSLMFSMAQVGERAGRAQEVTPVSLLWPASRWAIANIYTSLRYAGIPNVSHPGQEACT